MMARQFLDPHLKREIPSGKWQNFGRFFSFYLRLSVFTRTLPFSVPHPGFHRRFILLL